MSPSVEAFRSIAESLGEEAGRHMAAGDDDRAYLLARTAAHAALHYLRRTA